MFEGSQRLCDCLRLPRSLTIMMTAAPCTGTRSWAWRDVVASLALSRPTARQEARTTAASGASEGGAKGRGASVGHALRRLPKASHKLWACSAATTVGGVPVWARSHSKQRRGTERACASPKCRDALGHALGQMAPPNRQCEPG